MRIRNRGFTLIELLSIIVILAVISVITEPIVMNIVDESRKGTAKISALGYRDAIMKYYVAGITDGTLTNTDLDGEYNVLNGVLFSTTTSNNYPIPITGEVPESGNVDVIKGDLVSGCLQIGKYAVVFTGGNVSKVDKTDCIHASKITARQLLYTPPEGVETETTITNVQEALDEIINKLDGGN